VLGRALVDIPAQQAESPKDAVALPEDGHEAETPATDEAAPAPSPVTQVTAVPAPVQLRSPAVARVTNAVSAPVRQTRQFQVAAPEPEAVEEAAAPVEAPPAYAQPPAPIVALSSPYGRQRYSFRLSGIYCHDAAGGEVFMPAGAPVPENLAC
jgi:hypothetical protein